MANAITVSLLKLNNERYFIAVSCVIINCDCVTVEGKQQKHRSA